MVWAHAIEVFVRNACHETLCLAFCSGMALKQQRSESSIKIAMLQFSLDVHFQTEIQKEAFITRLGNIRELANVSRGRRVRANYKLQMPCAENPWIPMTHKQMQFVHHPI